MSKKALATIMKRRKAGTLSREKVLFAESVKESAVGLICAVYHPNLDEPTFTFGDIGESWQYDIIINPFFDPYIERSYVECPRDWDKTGLTAACAFAECAFSPGLMIRVYAADKDQAAITLDAINRRIIIPHPELVKSGDVSVNRNEILFSNGAKLAIESSDDSSAMGKGQDKAIFDELHCCRTEAHRRLFESVITKGRTKVMVITNPGAVKSGLCWDFRENVRRKWEAQVKFLENNPELVKKTGKVFWYSGEVNPFLPSWLNEKNTRARSNVPEGVFRRFHLCKWGEGGDLFSVETVAACMDDYEYADMPEAR